MPGADVFVTVVVTPDEKEPSATEKITERIFTSLLVRALINPAQWELLRRMTLRSESE